MRLKKGSRENTNLRLTKRAPAATKRPKSPAGRPARVPEVSSVPWADPQDTPRFLLKMADYDSNEVRGSTRKDERSRMQAHMSLDYIFIKEFSLFDLLPFFRLLIERRLHFGVPMYAGEKQAAMQILATSIFSEF